MRSHRALAVCAFSALAALSCSGVTNAPIAKAPDAKAPATSNGSPDPSELVASSFALERDALKKNGLDDHDIARLDTSAFRYFRLLARPYEIRTCGAFRDLRWSMPVVAVHGDAHLEQFVVTNDTFGVEDFDQSGMGPAVVDLVRYAASIALAARELGWPCDADRSIAKFFAAYRAALDHQPPTVTAPSVVARLRKRAPQARAAWLDWVGQQMHPLQNFEEARARRGWAKFIELQTAVRPDRPPAFFDIVSFGELHMGVGSAQEKKVLARIRGPSTDPNDDVVIEGRAGGDKSASGCVWRPDRGDSLHILRFMALLGPRMPEVFGYVGLADTPGTRPFWVQSWSPGYVELALEDVETQQELDELAESAAVQLAGYFWLHEQPVLRPYHRFSQLHSFDLVHDRAVKLASDLAKETVREWERFRTKK